MFEFVLSDNQPILEVSGNPELGGNINGPSLIKVPDWISTRLGSYYLYFAHHEGESIRLAYADSLTGPWIIHQPGAIQLHQSGFTTVAPKFDDMDEEVQRQVKQGLDGDYPHIASPDAHVDHTNKRIVLYYHGRVENGTQHTRVAFSADGINFDCQSELLGQSYMRVFEHQGVFFGLTLGAWLYRSSSGLTAFERGPQVTPEKYRHGAVIKYLGEIWVAWSRAEDCPERILLSRLITDGDWTSWQLSETRELRRPELQWEGRDEPLIASRYGGVMHSVHQLRDPCFFLDNEQLYLLYSIAGEQGIAMGQLRECD